MVEGEGELLLRGAEEPVVLESPTTISGTNDGGAISDGTFSSPDISFERVVTSGGITTNVEITASFSEITPGSVTGSINDVGDIDIDLGLQVDLALFVALANDTYECRATPIPLELRSVAPYDEDTDSVVLANADFSVPNVPVTSDCIELVANGINQELAGSGHSITLPLTGVITPPPFPGFKTLTELAVSPTSSTEGDLVTMTATVEPDPTDEGEGIPSGTVDFLNDGQIIGSAPLSPEGVAVFSNDQLPAGVRDLTANYRGVPETWDNSSSMVVEHRVAALPVLSADLPGSVGIGEGPVDFTATVTNTGFGDDLAGTELSVTVGRAEGNGPIGPDGGTPRIVLSRVVGGAATPISLTASGFPEQLDGTVLEAGTWTLPAGDSHVEDLRIRVSDATDPGPLKLTLSLVRPGEGGGEDTVVATSSGTIDMVEEDRRATQILAGDDFFFPPITPVAARQGSTLDVFNLRIEPFVGGRGASGYIELSIDGVPAPARREGDPSTVPFGSRVPIANGGNTTYVVQIPPTTPTGTRQVTARYSGDAFFAPSVVSWPVRVEPAVGPTYECLWGGSAATFRTLANVQAQATLPGAWPAGTTMPFTNMDVQMFLSRSINTPSFFSSILFPEDYEQEMSFGVGPDGTATAVTASSENFAPMSFDDGSSVDHVITFEGSAGTAVIEGDPGDLVDVTLESIEIHVISGGGLEVGYDIVCTPVNEAVVLDQVLATGTTLSVIPGGPVSATDQVTLTATTLPVAAGTVEFRAGDQTVGFAPSVNGVATVVTDDLPAGLLELTAIFRGTTFGPVTTSDPVEIHVVGTCATELDSGHGAVVRLVYMELLGRCPDAAGYAFWVGRLEGGATPEAFARSIARTPEAVGRVVDDAYRTMLDRPADAAGRAFWTGQLQAHGRYDRLLADLGASPEFWAKAGSTNAGFVTRVYDRLLHRSPEQSGLDYWVGRLEAGASRRTLILSLANLDEPLGVLVTSSYGEILDRAPDAGERTAGIGHLRSTGDRSGLYAQLIGRPEFGTRAQSFPED